MPTVAALFKDIEAAQLAAEKLSSSGVPEEDISIISNQSEHLTTDVDPVESTTAGASIGAVGGGALGLVAGLALMPVSGLGLVGVLGWLATSLAGASAGVVAGATAASVYDILRTSGAPEKEAHFYTEGLRAGGALVAVKAAGDLDSIAEILRSAEGAFAASEEDNSKR